MRALNKSYAIYVGGLLTGLIGMEQGTYTVALHESHYKQLVLASVSPPPTQPQQVS